MKKLYPLLIATLMFSALSANAQEDSKHEFAVSAGAGVSNLHYGIFGGKNPLGYGGQVGLEYMYYITPRFSLGTGVEFGFYKNDPKLKDGINILTPMMLDDDYCGCDQYFKQRFYGFKEEQRTYTFNIPIMAQYNLPIKGETRLYLRGGMKIGIPIVSKYSVKIDKATTSIIRQYYIEDPDGGHYWGDEHSYGPGLGTRSNMRYEGTNKLKTSYSVSGEAGLRFKVASSNHLYIGGYVDYGLNNIRRGATYDGIIDSSTADDGCSSGCDDELSASLSSAHSVLQLKKHVSKVRLVSYGVKLRFSFGGCKTPAAVEPKVVYVDRVVEKIVEKIVERERPAPTVEEVVPARKMLSSAEEQILLTPIIYDQINRHTLSEPNRELVESVAKIMEEKEWLRVLIEGHTCDIGTDTYNERLGERRAASVAEYLQFLGIAQERMQTVSKGSKEPALPNTTPYNRSQNRRAEFKVLK